MTAEVNALQAKTHKRRQLDAGTANESDPCEASVREVVVKVGPGRPRVEAIQSAFGVSSAEFRGDPAELG